MFSISPTYPHVRPHQATSDCELIHRLHGRGDTLQGLFSCPIPLLESKRRPRTHGDYRCGKFTTSGQRHTRGLRCTLFWPVRFRTSQLARPPIGSHLREAMPPLHGAYFIRFSDFPIWEDATLAHTGITACPNSDERGKDTHGACPYLAPQKSAEPTDSTLTRGLLFRDAAEKDATPAMHLK